MSYPGSYLLKYELKVNSLLSPPTRKQTLANLVETFHDIISLLPTKIE